MKSKTRRSSNLNLISPEAYNNGEKAYCIDEANGSVCGSGAADNGGVVDEPVGPSPSVYFPPPYTYAATDAANCALLLDMISQAKNYMMASRMPTVQRQVYTDWIAYAEQRKAVACAVDLNPPQTSVPEMSNPFPSNNPPVLGPVMVSDMDMPQVVYVPETPVPTTAPVLPTAPTWDEPSADNPPTVITDVTPEVEPAVVPGGSSTDTQTPGIIETLFPPIVVPYPMGNTTGNTTDPAATDDALKYRNWFWIMFSVVAVVGVITYKKKSA